MAINLASKYHPSIVEKFRKDSFLAGKTNTDYDFAGVRSITVYTPVTQALNDYSRTASSNRFGTPAELQDTIQELYLSQDKSFAITIDKGNNQDQMNTKEAGRMLKLQLEEQSIPFMDKYAFKQFAFHAGQSVAISAPTTSTIVGLIATGLSALDNALVPDDNRFIYVGATMAKNLVLSAEVLASDPLAEKVLGKGVFGTFMGHPIVKVPDSYFVTNLYFMIIYKMSVVFPLKFKTLRILTDAPGIDGALLEGRHFFDAFVLGSKADGVYAGVNTALKVGATTITPTGASHAITNATGSAVIYYTLDGSDPRYSKTRVQYASAVTLTSGQTIRAVGTKANMCDGDVAEATYTA